MAESSRGKRKRRTMDLTQDGPEDELPSFSLPSSDHRNRPTLSFLTLSPAERLVQEPQPLSESVTVPIAKDSSNPKVTDRVARSWSKNIGSGPTWELMEDKGWFKEPHQASDPLTARPLVYSALEDQTFWEEIPPNEENRYFPKGRDTTQLPEIACAFGLFEKQTLLKLKMFDSLPMSQFIENKESHVIYAGGPVWTLDWCPLSPEFLAANEHSQYLAIAPLQSASQRVLMTRPPPGPFHGSIQIWTYSRDAEQNTRMTCDLVLCFDSGAAIALQWCPLPSHCMDRRRLGLLACIFEDGSLQIFAVPIPEMIGNRKSVRLGRPCVYLSREELTFTCLDWANSDLLALGGSNGSILVYSVSEALHSGPTAEPVPLSYFSMHQSVVRSVSWVTIPPVKGDGSFATDRNPTAITSVAFDGVLAYTSLKEQASYMINRTRETLHAVSFSPQISSMVASDGDAVKAFAVTPNNFGKRHHILEALGPVLSIGLSDYHPYVAVGSADGTCQTTNMAKNPRRGVVPYFVYKIFQLDYSRTGQEYRMLENFLPHETKDRGPPIKTSGTKSRADMANPATGAWSPEVAVTCTRWNEGCGVGQASLLASATASGLCRVEWLSGRFHGGRVPFGSVEAIRDEVTEDVAGEDIENVE